MSNNWRHINKQVIESLAPCTHRWENYLEHYEEFSGDIVEFLELENISPEDKIWVFARVAPRLLVEIFAVDCAFSANTYAVCAVYAAYAASYAAHTASYAAADAATYAAYAADAAANAATYAVYTAANTAAAAKTAAADARKQAGERQVDAIIMILEGEC